MSNSLKHRIRFLFAACVLIFQSHVFTQSQPVVSRLLPNTTTERQLTGVEVHRYAFEVKAGQFVQVRVEQKGVDVALKFFGPSGETLATMDSPNAKSGFEVLSHISDKDGDMSLEVRGFDEKGGAGIYTIKLENLRPATGDDKKRIEMERTFVEGMNLRAKPDQIDLTLAKFESALIISKGLADAYMTGLIESMIADRSNFKKRTAANQLVGQARKLFEARDPDSLAASFTKFDEARRLYVEIGDKRSEAWSELYLGKITETSDVRKSVEYLARARDLFRNLNEKVAEALALTNIGQGLFALGENKKALEAFEETLRIAAEVGAKSNDARMSEAVARRAIGQVHSQVGDYQKALAVTRQALALFEAEKDRRGESDCLNNIGMILLNLGDAQQAVKYLERSLQISTESGNKSNQARTLSNIGLANFNLGENHKALERFNKSLELVRELGDREGEATALVNISSVTSAFGEKQKALGYLDQALKTYRDMANKRGEADTLVLVAAVLGDLNDRIAALDKLSTALTLAKELGNRTLEGSILQDIGRLYKSSRENGKALEFYSHALEVHRKSENKVLEAKALVSIADLVSFMGAKDKALEHYSQALALYAQGNDLTGTASVLNRMGDMYSDIGQPVAALEHYNRALEAARKIGDKRVEPNILNGIGDIYSDQGEWARALEFYNLALKIHRQAGFRRGETVVLNDIGDVYYYLREMQKAIGFYEQALAIRREIGDKDGEGTSLGNLGDAYYRMPDRAKALEYYLQSLAIRRQIGDKEGESITLKSVGEIYMLRREKEKALECFTQALAITRQIHDKRGEAIALSKLGTVYIFSDHVKALDLLIQSLAIRRQIGDKNGEAITLNAMGLAHRFGSADKQKAVALHSQALTIYREIGDKSGEAITLDYLMDIGKSLNNPNLAIFYGKQSVNRYQELRRAIRELDKEAQQTYTSSVEDTYRTLSEILIAKGRIAEAEQVLSMLKEEEYFSYLRRDASMTMDLTATIPLSGEEENARRDYEKFAGEITRSAAEFGLLEKKKNALQLGDALTADDQKRYQDLKAKYDLAVSVFSKFLDELKVRFANSADQSKQVAAVQSDTLGLLKELNEPRTVIISTVVGEDRLSLIVTTSDIQTAHTVNVKAVDLNRLVSDFRNAVKDPRIDPRPFGKKLYDQLFPPGLQKDLANISADTIVWSLDGTLRYVPISALWDGEKYLAERYTNAVITLASKNKLDDAAKAPISTSLVFAVGVSKPFEKFSALPAVPLELCAVVKDPKKQALCESYGRPGVFGGMILADDDFTLDGFENNVNKSAVSMVHIASHFALNPGNVMDSFLLLGGGAERKFSYDRLKRLGWTTSSCLRSPLAIRRWGRVAIRQVPKSRASEPSPSNRELGRFLRRCGPLPTRARLF